MKAYLAIMLLLLSACSQNNGTPEIPVIPESISEVNITGNATLQIGQDLEIKVESDRVIRVPQATYYTKAGPWQIFKLQDGEWKEITFYKNCFNACEDVCTEQKVCVPGGPYPGCSRVRDKTTFLTWDLRELVSSTTDCGAGSLKCEQPSFVSPGKYKVVFSYRDDCEAGVSWTLEESPIYKKEFFFVIEE